MNAILSKYNQMEFHTDLRLVFEALKGRQNEFNWLMTDLECNHAPGRANEWLYEYRPGNYQYKDRVWISGEELSDIVNRYNIQFWWAVLSGFHKEYKIDINNLIVYPSADGNVNIWTKKAKPQHPDAVVEIICFDASYTIIISKDDDFVNKFKAFFKDSIDLDEFNQKHPPI